MRKTMDGQVGSLFYVTAVIASLPKVDSSSKGPTDTHTRGTKKLLLSKTARPFYIDKWSITVGIVLAFRLQRGAGQTVAAPRLSDHMTRHRLRQTLRTHKKSTPTIRLYASRIIVESPYFFYFFLTYSSSVHTRMGVGVGGGVGCVGSREVFVLRPCACVVSHPAEPYFSVQRNAALSRGPVALHQRTFFFVCFPFNGNTQQASRPAGPGSAFLLDR